MPGASDDPASGSLHAPTAPRYLNRELSWLDFNARVLHEVRDERNAENPVTTLQAYIGRVR